MEIIEQYGKDDLAIVYLGQTEKGHYIEFVESLQPPFDRDQKMVLIISTLLGCPVGCIMCDAGGSFKGKVTAEDMFAQIDHVVMKRFSGNSIPVKKFKVQFSRMGEPAFNDDVLKVLDDFPRRYEIAGFIPSLSTVGPAGRDAFFEELLSIKKRHYRRTFQLQFSIHSTDQAERDTIIPINKWDFSKIVAYSTRFHEECGKKITLNNLEHDIVRKDYNEPRIHMALVCAARGCPILRSEVYRAERLNDQLNEQSRNYLASPAGMRIERTKGTVYLSAIFKWYGKDFASIPAFVEQHSGQKVKALKIRYLDYDWRLNKHD